MPELPDVELYRSALTARVAGRPIEAVRIGNPFVVRTYDPPIAAVAGRTVRAFAVSASGWSSSSTARCSWSST